MKWIARVLAGVLLLLQYEIWFENGGLHHQTQKLQTQLDTLETKNKYDRLANNGLNAEITALNAGDEAAVEVARTQLGYVQQGEVFYRIEDGIHQ